MKNLIGIVNYNTGNIGSLVKTLKKIDCNLKIIENLDDFKKCNKIILPGVGSYNTALKYLKFSKFDKKIKNLYKNGVNILGICLGLQILFNKSEEDLNYKGLGIISGEVIRIVSKKYPTPNIGWNKIQGNYKDDFNKMINKNFYYFCHSYICKVNEKKIKTSFFSYNDQKYLATVKKNNIIGTQFHPELSGDNGIKILKYFKNAK